MDSNDVVSDSSSSDVEDCELSELEKQEMKKEMDELIEKRRINTVADLFIFMFCCE